MLHDEFRRANPTDMGAHQVGGHMAKEGKAGMLQLPPRYLLKPMQADMRGSREVDFYETIAQHPYDPRLFGMERFLCGYHGVLDAGSFQGQDQDFRKAWAARRSSLDDSQALILSTNYIVLDDVTAEYNCPCIMDLKMGRETFEPDASPEKKAKELHKYPYQVDLGFRIVGMRTYHKPSRTFATKDKKWGRTLTPDTVMEDGFGDFFNDGTTRRVDVIRQFYRQLMEVIACFEKQTEYQFYASSLLFVYDGDDTSGELPALRLIDFAHVRRDQRTDDGYLLGLRTAAEMFHSLGTESSL